MGTITAPWGKRGNGKIEALPMHEQAKQAIEWSKLVGGVVVAAVGIAAVVLALKFQTIAKAEEQQAAMDKRVRDLEVGVAVQAEQVKSIYEWTREVRQKLIGPLPAEKGPRK
jgi:acyl transferase domain-containing protein